MKPYSQLSSEYLVTDFFRDKKGGTFLDIGCAAPFKINNTAFLEKNYDWRGVAVDISPYEASKWVGDSPYEEDWNLRSNTHVYEANALEFDYTTAFEKASMPDVIDYLTVDLDTPYSNYILCKKLLSSKDFRMVQIETDEYALRDPNSVLSEIHQTFENLGYEYFVTLAAIEVPSVDPLLGSSSKITRVSILPQDIIFVNKQYAEETFSHFPNISERVKFVDNDSGGQVTILPSSKEDFNKSLKPKQGKWHSQSCFYRLPGSRTSELYSMSTVDQMTFGRWVMRADHLNASAGDD